MANLECACLRAAEPFVRLLAQRSLAAAASVTQRGAIPGATSVVLQDARFPECRPTGAVYVNPMTPAPWLDQSGLQAGEGLLFSRAETLDARIWTATPNRGPSNHLLPAPLDIHCSSHWIKLPYVPCRPLPFPLHVQRRDCTRGTGSAAVLAASVVGRTGSVH